MFAFVFSGCVSARMQETVADSAFKFGRYEEAASRYEAGLQKQGDDGTDALLYLVEMGLAYHSAGKYEESNKAFLKADKIAEIKDYTSLAAEGATLLASDTIKQYPGEDFEKVLINTYLAMNFAAMGNIEDALVEARRVNQKLYRMVNEGQRKYKQNAFARYLSGVLYEAEGNWSEAAIDYKEVLKLEPGLETSWPTLGMDLYRVEILQGQKSEAQDWAKRFKLTPAHTDAAKRAASKAHGEIIVLYENGISPRKFPHPQFHSVPKFYARYNPVRVARVLIGEEVRGQTMNLHDIEETAIKNLDDKYAGIVAKKVAGLVAKGAVGVGVAQATKSATLGYLAAWALNAADQADTRSWFLLPRDLQVYREAVEPGTYEVRVDPIGAHKGNDEIPKSKTIEVKAGQKVFVAFRYIPAF